MTRLDKAFILAAGRGERMRPLTDRLPKPLLSVGAETLLDRQITKLVAAGIREIIINTAYLGHLIVEHVGDGSQFGASVKFSHEPAALETAGAIAHASSLLGEDPFLLVNGDVWMDLDFGDFLSRMSRVQDGGGHLVFVDNPAHKRSGDFALDNGRVRVPDASLDSYTFSGVSILSPSLITEYPKCREAFPLREVFDWAIAKNRLSGELYCGYWLDVGTPERLDLLRSHVLSG